mmetsp:Transcript_120727/g.188472  ORF Transcript_120727/g.188472 Transcript_120727/m.188472 type:complete len:420 (+) Transcript_120727:81-1340(+)
MGNGNMTPTLVTTLETSKDERMKEVAAEKLMQKVRQYGDHNDYIKAVGSHAGKPLVEMLKNGTPKGKTNAAATLSFLARHKESKEEIVKHGAIPQLVQLGKEGKEDQQAAVACAFANLASGNAANQAAIAAADAIPLLVDIVKSGRGEAKGWATSALGNLVLEHPKNQKLVAEAGAIPAIVELLQSHTAYVPPTKGGWLSCSVCRKRAPPHSKRSEMAARALSSIAYNSADNQAKIVDAGGIEALVRVIKEGSPEDEIVALKALGFVWGAQAASPAKAKLLDTDGVRVLIEIVRHSTNVSKSEAANFIARLAHQDSQAQAALATSGAISALVEMGQTSTHPPSKIAAVKALRELSSDNSDNQKLIEEAGGKDMLRLSSGGMKFRELSEEEHKRFEQDRESAANIDPSKEEDVRTPLVTD